MRTIATVAFMFVGTSCRQSSDVPPAPTAAPSLSVSPPTVPSSNAAPMGATDAAAAAPMAVGSTASSAPAAMPAPSSAPDAAAAPGPAVKLTSIGMHVAGGPYDEATKVPFLRAVEPHYPELAQCWSRVTKPKQGDVGVDLQIEAAGGRARVSNPRSTLQGEGFVPCVVAFFEKVEFEKSSGRRVVSYSVRFTPK